MINKKEGFLDLRYGNLKVYNNYINEQFGQPQKRTTSGIHRIAQ